MSDIPKLIPIQRIEDYYTKNIGSYSAGMFMGFVVAEFDSGMPKPMPKIWAEYKNWYAILHKFSRDGTHIGTDFWLAGKTLWYQAVVSLQNKKIRDYLLLLLFTGLRRNEAASLTWNDIDLEAKVLTVRAEITKNHREHRLPISDFLYALLMKRKLGRSHSEFVFPGRREERHMKDSKHVISQVAVKSGCPFIIHDLRRNFLTAAEKLDVPYYALRKLAIMCQPEMLLRAISWLM